VDDLWALAVTSLPDLRGHDAGAARLARLSGRDLEPWRAVLAVAHWLDRRHGVAGLFDRMEALSVEYQGERCGLEERDPVRVAVKALFGMLGERTELDFAPKELACAMNTLAVEDGLADEAGPDVKADAGYCFAH
jgi:hypothetical protein